MNPHDEGVLPAQYNEEEDETCKIKHNTSKVSFEDYLSFWKGIATSNAWEMTSNPLAEYLKTDKKLQNAHFELSQSELEQEIRTQLAAHNKLMYGTFHKKDEGGSYSLTGSTANRIHVPEQVFTPKPSE